MLDDCDDMEGNAGWWENQEQATSTGSQQNKAQVSGGQVALGLDRNRMLERPRKLGAPLSKIFSAHRKLVKSG